MNAANTDMLDIQSYELKSMPREVFILKGLRRLYSEWAALSVSKPFCMRERLCESSASVGRAIQ